MKSTVIVLITALLATVMLSGCFWEPERRGDDRGRDHDRGQTYDHDRDHNGDGDRH